jgi:hypothetical protein
VTIRSLIGIAAVFLASAGQLPPSTTGGRQIVVISDLHMGLGKDAVGAWDRHEDFRWAADFDAFLTAVDREGKSAVDLVLNGDSFDLLYAPRRTPAVRNPKRRNGSPASWRAIPPNSRPSHGSHGPDRTM